MKHSRKPADMIHLIHFVINGCRQQKRFLLAKWHRSKVASSQLQRYLQRCPLMLAALEICAVQLLKRSFLQQLVGACVTRASCVGLVSLCVRSVAHVSSFTTIYNLSWSFCVLKAPAAARNSPLQVTQQDGSWPPPHPALCSLCAAAGDGILQ